MEIRGPAKVYYETLTQAEAAGVKVTVERPSCRDVGGDILQLTKTAVTVVVSSEYAHIIAIDDICGVKFPYTKKE